MSAFTLHTCQGSFTSGIAACMLGGCMAFMSRTSFQSASSLTRGVQRCQQTCVQVRVYTKKVGAKPDFGDPVILSADRGGTLLEHLCRQIHNSMVAQLNYALVWGTSSKHYPQRCVMTCTFRVICQITCLRTSFQALLPLSHGKLT